MSVQAHSTAPAGPRRRIRANAAIGGLIIGVLVATALLSAVWTPYDPLKIDILSRFKPPSAAHWLGTDEFGRDVLSRAMSGAATSAWISLLTVATAVTGGTLVGVLTGYMRGWVDRIIMVFNDALLAFPGILLALGIMAVLGANKYGIILALGLAYMPSVVRVVRGTVLSIRGREYVEASQIMGNSELFTMARHVLPNCIAPLTVLATSMFGWVLLSESALSFLGLGVPPPAPTWGNMLAGARPYMQSALWLGLAPGACIALTLLGINLLGDSVRDRLDPRMAAA
jgi:peptide/nickel transport system permease protein